MINSDYFLPSLFLAIIFFGFCCVFVLNRNVNRPKEKTPNEGAKFDSFQRPNLTAAKLPIADVQRSITPELSAVPFDSDDFKARFSAGATLEELAAEFDCSIRAVTSRLRRYGLDYSKLESKTAPIQTSQVKRPKKSVEPEPVELEKLKHLLKIEAITIDEYELMRAKI